MNFDDIAIFLLGVGTESCSLQHEMVTFGIILMELGILGFSLARVLGDESVFAVK